VNTLTINDEGALRAWLRWFLEQEGPGRALVVVPDANLMSRLLAFMRRDLPGSLRGGWGPGYNFHALYADRLAHVTTGLPDHVDRDRCDHAVFYMTHLWNMTRHFWAQRVLGVET
jgi:hypothetical protein